MHDYIDQIKVITGFLELMVDSRYPTNCGTATIKVDSYWLKTMIEMFSGKYVCNDATKDVCEIIRPSSRKSSMGTRSSSILMKKKMVDFVWNGFKLEDFIKYHQQINKLEGAK